MTQFNIKNDLSTEENYQNGLLPQRNSKDFWYLESSCRSNLNNFNLNSENRRILRKTENFSFIKKDLSEFQYTKDVQKNIFQWIKKLNWEFPSSSIKNIFTNHIFNTIYQWFDEDKNTVAYAICYFSPDISHIAYVFYDPKYDHSNLPIRLVIQTIIDSHYLGLKYCYLGRFSQNTGYYKRNMPGFEYFQNNNWSSFQ